MSGLERRYAFNIRRKLISDEFPRPWFAACLEKLNYGHVDTMDIWKHLSKFCFLTEKQQEEQIISFLLEKNDAKLINKINRVYLLDEKTIEGMFHDMYSTLKKFLIIGCPTSTDIDVLVFVDQEDQENGQTKPLRSSSVAELRSSIQALGYDTTRDIDINVISVEDGKINGCSKGGSTGTTMIALSTWMHHKQEVDGNGTPTALVHYPMNFPEYTEEILLNAITAFALFFLKHFKVLCSDYETHRNWVRFMFKQNSEDRMKKIKGIESKLHLSEKSVPKDKLTEWRSCWKSIMMKYLQIISFYNSGETRYTKEDLATYAAQFQPGIEDSAKWYLFRGKQGSGENVQFLLNILDNYNKLVVEILDPNRFTRETIVLTPKKCTSIKLPPHVITEFLQSPVVPSDKFEGFWKDGDYSINDVFPIPTTDEAEFYKLLSSFPEILKSLWEKFIFEDQRTDEWHRLHTFYKCGRNSGGIGSGFQGKYNLIRGCIIEALIIENLDTSFIGSTVIPFSLGFVVAEKDVQDANGTAPDLMLLVIKDDTVEIIPVEIKGLKYGNHNSDFYRGLNLASKQVRSAGKIIKENKPSSLIVNRGLVILAHIHEENLEMERTLVDI